jgi:predicted nucleic acid-binding protein
MINNLQHAIILDRLNIKEEANDPADAFLISIAIIVGEANYLVTGDKRAGLLQQKNIGRTRVLTPSSFCKNVLKV